MVFSSVLFLSVFLPAVLLLYRILPGIRAKNGVLLIASLLFYAYGEPVFIGLLLLSAGINALLIRVLERRKLTGVLILAIIWNLLLLFWFKYAGFLVELVNAVFHLQLAAPQIPLPIGISFFTFQALSCVLDVWRGEWKEPIRFSRLLLYLMMFPQLIAGPIVKYHDFAKEAEARTQTADGLASGFRRFLAGLSKKVLLADVLAVTADAVFGAKCGSVGFAAAWIGAIAYMLQIYFDFSGYSDMAIGLGWMFGFHFRENFADPYCAHSVREFWKRWHISLTDWFREYLYIPLGGNRKGALTTARNRMIVFICTGLWHGANVTFLLWGLFHGLCCLAEDAIEKWRRRQGRNASLPVVSHLVTLLAVCVGFVLFRAETVGQGMFLISRMFAVGGADAETLSFAVQLLNPECLLAVFAAVFACLPVRRRFQRLRCYEALSYAASIAGLLLCMMSLAGSTYHPFIYFQF